MKIKVDLNKNNIIESIGYNGLPKGCSDDEFPWERTGEFLDTKYPYVVHAEPNAILNATSDLTNATLYVTLFPCNECAKAIIQSGIKEVIYLSDKYAGTEGNIAAKKMFDVCNIKYREYKKKNKKIEIEL